jgi:Helitron helicase-like domain at N-terminus
VRDLVNGFRSACQHVIGSPESFRSLQSRSSAHFLVHGPPSVFINLNPSDIHSSVLFHCAGHEYSFDQDDIVGKPVGRPATSAARNRIIAGNPVAAAHFFHTFIKCFLLHFLGWDSQTMTRVKDGLWGSVDAIVGKFETGRRGVLHAHVLAFIRKLQADRLAEQLSNVDYRPVIFEYLQHMMRMYLPDPLHMGVQPGWGEGAGTSLPTDANYVGTYAAAGLGVLAQDCMLPLKQALNADGKLVPSLEQIERGLAAGLLEFNYHKHSYTCDPNKRGALPSRRTHLPWCTVCTQCVWNAVVPTHDCDCRMLYGRPCHPASYDPDSQRLLLRRDYSMLVPHDVTLALAVPNNAAVYLMAEGDRDEAVHARWEASCVGRPESDLLPEPARDSAVAAAYKV